MDAQQDPDLVMAENVYIEFLNQCGGQNYDENIAQQIPSNNYHHTTSIQQLPSMADQSNNIQPEYMMNTGYNVNVHNINPCQKRNNQELALYRLFSQLGPIISIEVLHNMHTGLRETAAIVFGTYEGAAKAVSLSGYACAAGRVLTIFFS
ncbi:RNA recognition motif domain-containing protein [Ditylenchus destructor]|uniref:RNA recognition motif domain-containing protein n=1 Tax=Ditylenchus destructor TaxID=166010 RepID=A0AAD4MRS7_9BILA|nr:RNA recognition motif domain-containing protein [Ditylenchus destructor]